MTPSKFNASANSDQTEELEEDMKMHMQQPPPQMVVANLQNAPNELQTNMIQPSFVPNAIRKDTSVILTTSVQQTTTFSEGEMISNTKAAINKKGLTIQRNHLSSKVSPAITVELKDTSNVTVARKSEIKKTETLIASEQNKQTSHILKK